MSGTIVPTGGTTGDAAIVNQLLEPRQVAYNQFGSSAYNAVDNTGIVGIYATYAANAWTTALDLNAGSVAQLFTPGSNTTFKGVEVFPAIVGDDRATLVVQLQTVSGGAPSGTVLQEVHVPASVIAAKAAAQVNPTIGIYGGATAVPTTQDFMGTIGNQTALAFLHFDGSPSVVATVPYDIGQTFPAGGGAPSFNGVGASSSQQNYPDDVANNDGSPAFAYYNGFLYAVGGTMVSGMSDKSVSDVYMASMDPLGNLGTWQSVSPGTLGAGGNGVANAGAVVVLGTDGLPYLVVIGGLSIVSGVATANNAIYWAQIGQGGSLVAPPGFTGWGSAPLTNTLLAASSGSPFAVAAPWNGTAVVGGVDQNVTGAMYGAYVLVNNLPTSVSLSAVSAYNDFYAGSSAVNLGWPWFSTQGPLYAFGGVNGIAGHYQPTSAPTHIVKANAAGSNPWASNPYPVIGSGYTFPGAIATQNWNLNGSLIALGNGAYGLVSLGNGTFFGQQLEAFRVPFHTALTGGTQYALVFSVIGSTGSVGPGSSISLPLADSTNGSPVGCLKFNGSSWVNVPASANGYPYVAGFFFDTAGSPRSSQYAGYLDTSATIVPAWEVVYWNTWSGTPECVVSVAGNQAEILFPTGETMASA